MRRLIELAGKAARLASYLADPGPSEVKWATESLLIAHGHAVSRREGKPIDRDGKPLPWYTYPAIAYLSSIDLRDKDVFEFGAGNSSLFWAERVRSLVSVEHVPEWHGIVKSRARPNQEVLLETDPDAYVASVRRAGRKYGVVVVDGLRRHSCARAALDCLADDGLIVLDNADWWPQTAALLRQADLLEVDFTGFGPVLNNTWTTSVFFRRSARVRPAGDRMPVPGIGSVTQAPQEE